jgi:hypothetical protein
MERSTALELMRELARPRPRAETVASAASHLDFVDLESELARQRLLPLLGTRLLKIGATPLPHGFESAVYAAVEGNRSRVTPNAMLTWSLVTELDASGIRAMPLKGPFLARRLHGDLAFRENNDVDILVSPRQMSDAVVKLEAIGGIRPRRGEALPELHHHFQLASGDPVELHWRIHWFEAAYTDRLLERAVSDEGLWVPSPADELISLLLFHARDGLIGLRGPVDIAACWNRHHDDDTIETVRLTANEYPQLAQALAAAAQSVERVLEIDIASRLALPTTRRGAVAVELTDWAVKRQPRELDLAAKLIDGLVAPKGGLTAYVRRSFFPRLEGPRSTRLARRTTHAIALAVRMAAACWTVREQLSARRRGPSSEDPVRLADPLPLRRGDSTTPAQAVPTAPQEKDSASMPLSLP